MGLQVMVVLDNSVVFESEKVPPRLPKISLTGLIALAAVIVVLGSLAAGGFSSNSLALASQNAWRFAAFVFFAALASGPLGRLIPGLERLAEASRFLGWGFCASYGVYLAVLLLPNAFGPDSMTHGQSAGTTLFVLFGAGVTLVMALAHAPAPGSKAAESVRRTLLGISAIYFWLCYALMGLAHLARPHRPDGFYGLSLSLMILTLLLRFADSCAADWRRTARHSATP